MNGDREVSKLKAEIKQDDMDISALNKQHNERKSDLDQARQHLKILEGSKKEKLSVYGTNMPEVVAAIQKNKSRFSEMPIGPLGLSVKLIKEEWWSVCENLFGKVLNGFLVTDYKDQKVLQEILQTHRWYILGVH